jgi:ADP-ribose pyrophosphatase YjhB (NUDIX family)
MGTSIYVGGLMIEDARIVLKARGGSKGEETPYSVPGKYLEGDETLEMAVSKGFMEDTGWACAVSDLVYVIESFQGGERELGFYFMVNVPAIRDRGEIASGCRSFPIAEAIGLDVRPSVLAGKIFADERRGHRGSATYLVSYVDG